MLRWVVVVVWASACIGCGSKSGSGGGAGGGSGGDGGTASPAELRTYWAHPRGNFQKNADGTWVEQAPDGPHNFVEKGRTADAVELSDPTRGITVMLYADHCTAKMATFPPNRLYEGAWAKPGVAEPTGPVAEWKSDAAQLAKLAPPEDVTGYKVRPPAGFTPTERTQGGTRAMIWQGKLRPDGSVPKLIVMVGKLGPGEDKRPIEQGAETVFGPFKRKLLEYSQGQSERGTINGLTFTRFTFQGKEEGKPEFVGHGVVYHGNNGPQYVHMIVMDCDPYRAETLPMLEAAARTLQKP